MTAEPRGERRRSRRTSARLRRRFERNAARLTRMTRRRSCGRRFPSANEVSTYTRSTTAGCGNQPRSQGESRGGGGGVSPRGVRVVRDVRVPLRVRGRRFVDVSWGLVVLSVRFEDASRSLPASNSSARFSRVDATHEVLHHVDVVLRLVSVVPQRRHGGLELDERVELALARLRRADSRLLSIRFRRFSSSSSSSEGRRARTSASSASRFADASGGPARTSRGSKGARMTRRGASCATRRCAP